MAREIERIKAYHERTKHHLERYARGPGWMDWDNQPDPFRTFDGCERVELPLLADHLQVPFCEIREGAAAPKRTLTLESLALLLELSMGLSAVKVHGRASWPLRCNPSSGNLHPTEAYVLCGDLGGLPGGVYHYLSRDHVLERRCALKAGAREAGFAGAGFLLGFSSVHWREAWKYGERAFRYCQHDAGHAMAAVSYAAAALGWRAQVMAGFGDDDVAAALGLDRAEDFLGTEEECPEALLWVGSSEAPTADPQALRSALAEALWRGRANRLSPESVAWSVIDEAEVATSKPGTTEAEEEGEPPEFEDLPSLSRVPREKKAVDVIRGRRSAQAFDGETEVPGKALFRLLDATLPRRDARPASCFPWRSRLHLLLLVHRVEDVEPGLYLLPRSREGGSRLREVMGEEWLWEEVPACPPHLPLLCLVRQDVQLVARILSCHQNIASDSAFSVGMIAQFRDALEAGGWWYRRLLWEAGALGQALYLEAEAAGFRGTGIGCFFDDEVHRLLGLSGDEFQTLYQFTVGTPAEDPRLKTIAPYGHLNRR